MMRWHMGLLVSGLCLLTLGGCAGRTSSPLPIVINGEAKVPNGVKTIGRQPYWVNMSGLVKAMGGSLTAGDDQSITISLANRVIHLSEGDMDSSIPPAGQFQAMVEWEGSEAFVNFNAFVLTLHAAYPDSSSELKKGQGLYIFYGTGK